MSAPPTSARAPRDHAGTGTVNPAPSLPDGPRPPSRPTPLLREGLSLRPEEFSANALIDHPPSGIFSLCSRGRDWEPPRREGRRTLKNPGGPLEAAGFEKYIFTFNYKYLGPFMHSSVRLLT